jgi:hypothetical protein
MTYTNFVDLLNTIFESLGLTFYKAQVSLKEQKIGNMSYNNHNGFYILRPANDTFFIETRAEANYDRYNYSETGLVSGNSTAGWYPTYSKSFCDGITIANNYIVSE